MRVVWIASLLALGGCASILDGTSQQIEVNTNPSGANCGFYRENQRIATVLDAPGSALVKKDKHDIWVACVKPGYQPASYLNHSGVAGSAFGNILAGGIIGAAIDSASGADNKYDSPINVTLIPAAPGTVVMTDLPSTFAGSFPTIIQASAVAPATQAVPGVVAAPAGGSTPVPSASAPPKS